MPVITRTILLPADRTSLVVQSVETSLCDAWSIGAWQTHDAAVDPATPHMWAIEAPVTGPDEFLRVRTQLLVDDANAIEVHRVTVPEGGPHQLDTLPVVDR